jgi:hypothetical protein
VRRVIRREQGTARGFARLRHRADAQPDPALLRRAASLTDLRERRAAYEAAQHCHPTASLRGSRVVAILTVACAAAVTFVLTVLAAIAGNAWVAATVAALVAAVLAVLARRGTVTAVIDNRTRPPRQFRDVRESLDD